MVGGAPAVLNLSKFVVRFGATEHVRPFTAHADSKILYLIAAINQLAHIRYYNGFTYYNGVYLVQLENMYNGSTDCSWNGRQLFWDVMLLKMRSNTTHCHIAH